MKTRLDWLHKSCPTTFGEGKRAGPKKAHGADSTKEFNR